MSKHDEQYINKFQNSKFKVWVHIEEINEDEDYYQDVGEPISIGEFENLDDAVDLVEAGRSEACVRGARYTPH